MDITRNHFALFELPVGFAIDRKALEAAYRQVLSQVHPDRFAAAGDAEKRVALQWATRANEAYRTLNDDVARARYLCELRGIALGIETSTAMPVAFLMEQMALRESLEDAEQAHDRGALEAIEATLGRARAAAIREVAVSLDGPADPANPANPTAAAEAVRKLMFLDRFAADVADALDRALASEA
jgi:molecular chaperone HscB